jgi:hypothetical protein
MVVDCSGFFYERDLNVKIILFAFCLVFVLGCSKNEYESCVDMQVEIAKRESPENWRKFADYSIMKYCGPGG